MLAAGDVLRFPGTLPGFAAAAASLRALLDAWHLRGPHRNSIDVVFEEIAINIVRHASSASDLEVGVALDGDEVVLTFVDDGITFDPRRQEAPSLPLSLDDATVGGLEFCS